ncbi:MAG: PEP-CTERM sorting domain-containing protein [Verrucomicrobiota bacterium]
MKTNFKQFATITGITMLTCLSGQAQLQLNMTTDSTGLQVSLLNDYTITVGPEGSFSAYDFGISFANVMDSSTTLGYMGYPVSVSGGGLELNQGGTVTDITDPYSIGITYGLMQFYSFHSGPSGADALTLSFGWNDECAFNPGDTITFLAGTYTASISSDWQYGTLLNPGATYSADQYSVVSATEQMGSSYDPSLMVVTPAPEPSTLALAGLGSMSLLLFRRRK